MVKGLLSIFAAFVRQEQLLAVDRNVLNDSFIAIIRQRQRIDLRLTVSPVEERFLFLWRVSGEALAAADEHQIPLFGRQDRIVPIDDVECIIGADQDVAGVNIGMT
jgi:hypothetical protein